MYLIKNNAHLLFKEEVVLMWLIKKVIEKIDLTNKKRVLHDYFKKYFGET